MHIEDARVGRRIREIRTWRGLSMTAAAQLAGIAPSYLSMIERGQRSVTKRSVLEALATALRVSPAELTGKPYAPSDRAAMTASAAMTAVGDALTGWWVGEVPDGPVRDWQDVRADVERLTLVLRPNAEFAAQAALIPQLVQDLLVAAEDSDRRVDALVGLMGTYKAAAYLAHDLGIAGLPMLAVERMRQAAEELADPMWLAYAAYQRAQLLSGTNRPRQKQLATSVADDAGARVETRGMAHLTAALASAAMGDGDAANTHLAEASVFADQIPGEVSPWMQTNFGRTNVAIWRLSIGVELGDGVKAAERASGVDLGVVTRARQAAFWIDYGRAFLGERRHRQRGLTAILRAEKLAPQKVQTNVFVREAVSSLLVSAPRDSAGRDLRGLAHRLGIAQTG